MKTPGQQRYANFLCYTLIVLVYMFSRSLTSSINLFCQLPTQDLINHVNSLTTLQQVVVTLPRLIRLSVINLPVVRLITSQFLLTGWSRSFDRYHCNKISSPYSQITG